MPRKKVKPMRSRKRASLNIDEKTLAGHICDSLTRDLEDRDEWNKMRVQRYAKYRGWREPKTFPWTNASNAHLPILMTECLRTQDTIHNAVLARHPVVESMAIKQVDVEKQKHIDNLLDYQFFVEQPGEETVAALVQQFVIDGVFLAHVPWVRYDEAVNDLHIFNPIPDTVTIADGVRRAMEQIFQIVELTQIDTEGFRWRGTILDNEVERKVTVEAYIQEEGGRLELNLQRDVRAYDGPVVIAKSVDEWVVPWRSDNVQAPSPANPNGAEHVLLLDYPTLDEIRRLQKQGYYDLMTDEDLTKVEGATHEDPTEGEENSEQKVLKDEFEGIHGGQGRSRPDEVSGAQPLTRIQAFLGWDVNGDGLEEQLVVWMIRETKTILRVRYLTEAYPSDPPLRPLASAAFLPVEGRAYGISLLELLESLHDLQKITYDQMVDAATIKNVPWFAYRPTSGVNPETLRIAPGEGVPMNDPERDLKIMAFTSQSDAYGLNMLQLLSQIQEKASMQGDIQFGRVPKGKASALRTASGMQSILSQGDARPERILRRFFSGFKDIYRIMHELNQRFLPPQKQFRLMEPDIQGRNVYESVDDIAMISGRMQFKFTAGAFNSDKNTAIEVLQTLMQMLINPLTLQMGVVQPQHVHNILTDFIKLVQHEPSRYLTSPKDPEGRLSITAQEAINVLLNGRMPQRTTPAEGPQQHIQQILAFMQQPEAEEIDKFVQALVQVYITNVQSQAQEEAQRQQLLQQAQQFQQSLGGGGTPGPQAQGEVPNSSVSGNPQVQQNELLDETLT